MMLRLIRGICPPGGARWGRRRARAWRGGTTRWQLPQAPGDELGCALGSRGENRIHLRRGRARRRALAAGRPTLGLPHEEGHELPEGLRVEVAVELGARRVARAPVVAEDGGPVAAEGVDKADLEEEDLLQGHQRLRLRHVEQFPHFHLPRRGCQDGARTALAGQAAVEGADDVLDVAYQVVPRQLVDEVENVHARQGAVRATGRVALAPVVSRPRVAHALNVNVVTQDRGRAPCDRHGVRGAHPVRSVLRAEAGVVALDPVAVADVVALVLAARAPEQRLLPRRNVLGQPEGRHGLDEGVRVEHVAERGRRVCHEAVAHGTGHVGGGEQGRGRGRGKLKVLWRVEHPVHKTLALRAGLRGVDRAPREIVACAGPAPSRLSRLGDDEALRAIVCSLPPKPLQRVRGWEAERARPRIAVIGVVVAQVPGGVPRRGTIVGNLAHRGPGCVAGKHGQDSAKEDPASGLTRAATPRAMPFR
mmetsp:Transcript_1171/g.3320  ORF Transcript_1171/g.3320 Transcript_1171/m.3320 type:complete len:477 (-) Transcript_1171:148-1578(-)